MKTKDHRPVLELIVCFAIGIVASQHANLSLSYLFGLVVVVLILISMARGQKIVALLIVVLFCFLGMLRVQTHQQQHKHDIDHVARFFYGENVRLVGIVDSDIQQRDFHKSKKTTFTLAVKKIEEKWGWRKRTGKTLVNVFRPLEIAYGDLITIEGKLHRPFNFSSEKSFSYPKYLEHRGIRWVLSVKKSAEINVMKKGQGSPVKALALSLRNHLCSVFTQYLTPSEAGIMQAVILGDRTHIPKHVRELFVRTGTAHILAISGLHVGIVTFLFLLFWKLFPLKRKAYLSLTIILLIAYCFISGGRPSVIRATIMAVVLLGSFVFERESDTLNALAIAAFMILLWNPFYIYDIGFQLSFGCVLSIVLLRSKIQQILESVWPKNISQAMSVSMSVCLGSAGLIAYYFQIFTPVSVIANLLIVPLLGVIVALGFGLMISSHIFGGLAVSFASCIKVGLNLTVGATFLLDKLPLAHFFLKSVTIWQVGAYYLFLGLIFIIPFKRIMLRLGLIRIRI